MSSIADNLLSTSLQKKERFLKFARQKDATRKILVIRNGLLGDAVFITPVLQRLRSTFPSSIIDILVSKNTVQLFYGFPGVRNVFSLSDRFSLFEHVRVFLGLRRYKYDVIVIVETNSHYTIMSKLAGARFLCGLENSLGSWLDVSIPWSSGLHFVRAALGTVVGWTHQDGEDRTLLVVSQAEKEAAEEFLRAFNILENDYLVCIHPGCSSPHSERQWIPKRYSELADRLIERYDAKIVFTGIQQDEKEIGLIRAGMSHSSVSLAGKTPLRLLLSVLDRSDLVVGPDTGTIHIACAVQTPVVMLVGAADPQYTGPFDPEGVSRFVRVDLPCIACVRREPKPIQWESCKNMRPVLCMDLLQTEHVLAAIEQTRAAAANTINHGSKLQ